MLIDEEDVDKYDEEAESSLALLVTIATKDGLSLEFECTAFQDEVRIHSLSLKKI